jgi:hypothetical protein
VDLPFIPQAGEAVLLTRRRHPLYVYPKLAGIVLVGLVPAVVLVIISTAWWALLLAALWAMFWAFRLYLTWYRYQNDMWIVTTQRVVDSSRKHWFHHRMASTDLVDVEDIAIQREGLLPTLFNFGNVQLQTAGVQANFVLSGIPKPADVLGTIDGARDQARRDLAARGSVP